MPKRTSTGRKRGRERDINRIAFDVVAKATAAPEVTAHDAAVALGKLGGKKGGPARAAKLTQEQRTRIASRAARARWGNAK